jgi:hypothetical protein
MQIAPPETHDVWVEWVLYQLQVLNYLHCRNWSK